MIFIKQVVLFPLKFVLNTIFNPVYKKNLAKIVVNLCPDNAFILDYGCDDGSTAKRIMELNPTLKIVGVDIQNNRAAQIPVKIFDGTKIPYPANTFDMVISLDVLHHTQNIPAQIKELKRVSKKYILIKDHVTYGIFSKALVSFFNYISNVPYGIQCAFNYPLEKEWYTFFKDQKLQVIKKPKKLQFGFGVGDTYNLVVKLQKE